MGFLYTQIFLSVHNAIDNLSLFCYYTDIMTEGMHGSHPEAFERLQQLRESMEPEQSEDTTNESGEFAVDTDKLERLMRQKNSVEGTPEQNAARNTIEFMRENSVPAEFVWHVYDREVAYAIAEGDIPLRGGKEDKASQMHRLESQYGDVFEAGVALVEAELDNTPEEAEPDEEKVAEPAFSSKPNPSETAKTDEVAPSASKAPSPADLARTHRKAPDAPHEDTSDKQPKIDPRFIDAIKARETAGKQEKTSMKEVGALAFAQLKEEGFDTKLRVASLRKLAAKNGLYEPKDIDGKKSHKPYAERMITAKRVAQQRFDELNPLLIEGAETQKVGATEQSPERQARREMFAENAAHLMSITVKEFEEMWLSYREQASGETQPKPDTTAEADAKPSNTTSSERSAEKTDAAYSEHIKDLKIIDQQGDLQNLKDLHRELRQGDFDDLDLAAQTSMAAALADRAYGSKYPEARIKRNKNLQKANHKSNFINRYVKLLLLTGNDLQASYDALEQEKADKAAPKLVEPVQNDARNGAQHVSPPDNTGDGISVGNFGASSTEHQSSPERKKSSRKPIRERLGNLALNPQMMYHRASAFVAERHMKRDERLSLMSKEELDKRNKRNLYLMGAAVLAVAGYAIASRFGGGFDLMSGSGGQAGGNVGGKGGNTTAPFLDNFVGHGSGSESHAQHGLGFDIDLGGSGGGDRDNSTGGNSLARNELFDGNRGSRSLTSENKARLNDFVKDYKVKSGDSVWKIAEKHLESQGVKNPSVFEIDATKDQILKSTGLKENSTLYAGRTLGN